MMSKKNSKNSQGLRLLIDRGNSYCKLATVREGVISPIERYKQLSPDIIDSILSNSDPDQIAAIYSGVGDTDGNCLSLLQEKVRHLLILGAETKIPLKEIHYDRTKIGADRLALAVGAAALHPGKSVLIIDIGTAITYDFVSREGELMGGDITAGPKTRLRSLHTSTARLPEVSVLEHSTESLFGTNTEEAISNGITRGIVAEIHAYIELALQEDPETITILTGGYTPFFANRIKFCTFVEPNLLMVGLNEILSYNE